MEWYKDGMYPEWHISGKNFSPNKLLEIYSGLIIASAHEKGEYGIHKWNKDKKHTDGSCKIVVDDKIINKLDWLLDFIISNQTQIYELGVEEEIIWLVWWGIQGNMELDSKLIEKLHQTGLDMAMNYYYIDDEPTRIRRISTSA